VSAGARAGRTQRASAGDRRRKLGQNFLRPEFAERFVAEAELRPGEQVVEIGAGDGALTLALAARGVDVLAVEIDTRMAGRLRQRLGRDPGRDQRRHPEHPRPEVPGRVRIVRADFLTLQLPRTPFRVVASVPYGRTTDVLHKLLDDPSLPLERADLIVQWEVARKRAATPPSTLHSTVWAPWWEFRLGRRIPARAFRPAPRVDSGVLVVSRRPEPLLPPAMAAAFGAFVREQWPFAAGLALPKVGKHPNRAARRRREGSPSRQGG
jgi:23S rRNA (adenine-N6)-dimethyltransferase